MKSSLNAGTSYAGCKDGDGIITPEFEISQSKVIGADDCSENTVFVGREDEDALLASSVESDVYCGKLPESPSCLMKYHKYTGLPIWAEDVPPVAGLVPSTDGESVMIAGHYFAAQFGSVELPGYVREGGLATQTSGIYNTKLSSVDGTGSYALHSGGGAGDRLYDVVGDDEGNIYNVGYSMNLVMNWGNNLITEFSELDIDPNDVGTQAKETHFYASKLIAGVETQHSCLSSCTNDWSSAVIEDNSCFIDGRCYSKGQDGTSFGLSCFECNPEVSQTEWSQSSSIGVSQCYVDGVCVNTDDFKFYQRRTWGEKIFSKCQVCNPSENAFGWTVKEGYGAIEGASPPNDCKLEYQSCSVPSFEWATYSSSSTARMHVRQASVSEKFLYAAGYLKSTIDPSIEGSVLSSSDFTLTGPYSVSDPSGDDAKTIDIDLVSYPASQGYKENAGGSFGQYEVGVVKINKTTGKPIDIFVYPGHGYEETTGFVEKNNMLVMSGHFAGNLTTIMQDGTTKTIWNSNVPEGTLPNLDDQFHPNNRDASGHTGVDDGFVIKASAETGKAKWVSHYPQSNRDSSVVAVDLDEEGNVYGAGHKCMLLDGAEAKVCEGTIIKFDKDDGTIIWEKVFPDLGSALRITYDSEDCSVYFTGTTTYGGSTKDTKSHASCDHDTCSVVGRLNCKDASVDWIRTIG